MAWVLLLLLALFPVAAAIADLVADVSLGLPTDHQVTFAVLTGQQWKTAQAADPGVANYVTLLATGYMIHELVFGILFLGIVAVPWWRGQWWARLTHRVFPGSPSDSSHIGSEGASVAASLKPRLRASISPRLCEARAQDLGRAIEFRGAGRRI
jgi:hypothetical protein